MIMNFSCKETERIWNGVSSKKFPSEIQNRALRKLRQLDASNSLQDLKNPPSNNLEALQGNRLGQMSIRINHRWRICFCWEGNISSDVHIIDYHQ